MMMMIHHNNGISLCDRCKTYKNTIEYAKYV